MANYQTIIRLRPEVREFIRYRSWVHRGDSIAYGSNIRCDSFSTDERGYRHSTFGGETLSLTDCFQRDRYGLVLGASNVYGFGVAGNENTFPSVLAESLGFPFANISLPEGNSRNLFCILAAICARAPKPPAAVLHLSGGDFTNFCYTSIADPVFGSPNLKQMDMVLEERGGAPRAETQIDALFAFTTLWITAMGNLCRARNIPFVLGQDVTFFEKEEQSDSDRECELGTAFTPPQERQFATHKQFVVAYGDCRGAAAEALGVPFPGPRTPREATPVSFIDEFHYDREGTRTLCGPFGEALEAVL